MKQYSLAAVAGEAAVCSDQALLEVPSPAVPRLSGSDGRHVSGDVALKIIRPCVDLNLDSYHGSPPPLCRRDVAVCKFFVCIRET